MLARALDYHDLRHIFGDQPGLPKKAHVGLSALAAALVNMLKLLIFLCFVLRESFTRPS